MKRLCVEYGGSINTIAANLSANSYLWSTLEVIRHRGPDDEGRSFDNDLALGMQRLIIIDLAEGKAANL